MKGKHVLAGRAGSEARPSTRRRFQDHQEFMVTSLSSFELMKVKSHFNRSTMLSGQLGEIKINK